MSIDADAAAGAAEGFLRDAARAAAIKGGASRDWQVVATVDGVDVSFSVIGCSTSASCRFAEMANHGVDTENPNHLWAAGFRDGTSVTITGNSHRHRMELEQLL